MSSANKPVVVVVGGGYSGVLAANRICGRAGDSARVIMIAPGDSLTDRIRLHEVAARGGDARKRYATLLARGVEHVSARVTGFDPASRQVHFVRDGQSESIAYTALVLALGSQFSSSTPSTHPHAHALCDVEHAQRLAKALRELSAGERVIVVGGGLTAIELSAELADAHPHLSVELIASEFAAGLAGPARDALRAGVGALGVQLREGVAVSSIEAAGVTLADGAQLQAPICVLAAGMVAAPLGPGFPLATRPDGRIAVDEQLRAPGLPDVFVVGDLAAPPSAAIGNATATTRMACATAMPMGAHAADQVVRLLQARPLAPYRFGYALQCISLGRNNALVAFVDRDDRPTGSIVQGRPAALVKEAICRFVIGGLRLERWLAGVYTWPRPPRSRSLNSPSQLSA